MATNVGGKVSPCAISSPSWGGEYGWIGPTPAPAAPTIDLLSAAADGPLAVVLTFGSPPAGAVLDPESYALAPTGGGAALTVAGAELGDPASGEVYPTSVRLSLASQGTGGASYRVTVSGVVGPDGEALGQSSATWEAVAVSPYLLRAQPLQDGSGISVLFSAPMDPDTLASGWDLEIGGESAGYSVEQIGPVAFLLVLDSPIPGDSDCSVTSPAGAADLAGNTAPQATEAFFYSALRAISAVMISDRTVLVVFPRGLLQVSECGEHDAMNPTLWSVVPQADRDAPRVLAVHPTDDASVVIVCLSSPPASSDGYAAIQPSAEVWSAAGDPVIPDPISFPGIAAPIRPGVAAEAAAHRSDFRVPASQAGDPGLMLAEGGDYAMASGAETIRELAIRVLSTSAGEWAHAPAYGAAPAIGAAATTERVQRAIRAARSGILAIPGVSGTAISAGVSNGVIRLEAKIATANHGDQAVAYSAGRA